MKNSTRLARIVNQDDSVRPGNTDAYPKWLETNAPRDEEGNPIECAQANPDVLPEGTSYFGDPAPTRPQLLMGEAVEHLQGRQKEIYLLCMRQGYSIADAAKELGISKGTAQTYRERAINFIHQYCARNAKW